MSEDSVRKARATSYDRFRKISRFKAVQEQSVIYLKIIRKYKGC